MSPAAILKLSISSPSMELNPIKPASAKSKLSKSSKAFDKSSKLFRLRLRELRPMPSFVLVLVLCPVSKRICFSRGMFPAERAAIAMSPFLSPPSTIPLSVSFSWIVIKFCEARSEIARSRVDELLRSRFMATKIYYFFLSIFQFCNFYSILR